MTDFDTMMMDANRLKEAIRLMAKAEIKDDPRIEKSLVQRVHAAFIMVDRASNAEELGRACENLRAIFRDLNKRELEYERATPDTPQSRRPTSVRHSDEVGDGGRNLDSPDVGPQGVPILEGEPNRTLEERPRTDDGRISSSHDRDDAGGLARALPKRKSRSRRGKTKDRPERPPIGIDPKKPQID